jgi:hypothetical protein
VVGRLVARSLGRWGSQLSFSLSISLARSECVNTHSLSSQLSGSHNTEQQQHQRHRQWQHQQPQAGICRPSSDPGSMSRQAPLYLAHQHLLHRTPLPHQNAAVSFGDALPMARLRATCAMPFTTPPPLPTLQVLDWRQRQWQWQWQWHGNQSTSVLCWHE